MKKRSLFFGGVQKIVQSFDSAIKSASARAGLIGNELGEMIGLSNPSRIADQLNISDTGILNFELSEVMAMITQLGITVERIMPFDEGLSDSDRDSLKKEMLTSDSGPLAAADLDADLDEDLSIELFARLQALDEVFTKASVPAEVH